MICIPTEPLPEAIIISLNSGIPTGLEDCSFTGNKDACCVMGVDDGYCSSYQKMCSCEWKNRMLGCKFENTTIGKYCIMIEFRDHRCYNDVLCNWHTHHDVLKEPKIIPTVLAPVPAVVGPVLATAIVIASLFLLVGIFIILKRKYFVKRNQSLPLVIQKSVPDGEKPKVLLAYPRDCPLFMGTMAEFRKILKEILNVEVYDAWDSDIWEFVAEQKDRWGLHYCYDHNVKVILMATHCSRFIQDALLNGEKIEYSDPEPFDNVFIVILKCITEMVTEFTYKRIFVVRLDGTDCEENTYKYINPFTIYTIPQQLYALGHALWNSEHNEAYSSLTVTNLSSLIEKLNKYKSDNPYYFKHMIQIKKKEEE